MHNHRFARMLAAAIAVLAMIAAGAVATPGAVRAQPTGFTTGELVDRGHEFFGGVSEGLATIVEQSVARYGIPNGYVLGQEGSAAIIGGLRFGEGRLFTKNQGQHEIFWQGPSVGADVGGSGDRVMMLVYNLPDVDSMYRRYPGVAGTAHVVAGFGATVLGRDGVFVAPIVSGIGARLGVNLGYLKFTREPTWNPF